MHLAVYAVHNFRDKNGRYPENNDADLNEVVAIAKELAADLKSKDLHCVEALEEELVKKVAAYSTSSITSMSAMMGGFIA